MTNPVEFSTQEAQRQAVQAPREDNKLRIEDRAAHDWYRFVLSFPAHLVRTYIDRFGLNSKHTILDPFCGTGTTLVECKKLGIASHGIEPNPMAAFASRTKVNWETDPEYLTSHATHVSKLALEKLAREGIEDEGGLPLFVKGSSPENGNVADYRRGCSTMGPDGSRDTNRICRGCLPSG